MATGGSSEMLQDTSINYTVGAAMLFNRAYAHTFLVAKLAKPSTTWSWPVSKHIFVVFTCDEAHTDRLVLLAADLRDHAFPDRHDAVHRAEKKPDISRQAKLRLFKVPAGIEQFHFRILGVAKIYRHVFRG